MWRTLKFIWIDYEQLIRPMDCFDCIFIPTNNLAYLIPIRVFSMVSWVLHCSTCSKNRKDMKPNENISKELAKVLSFVWEKVLKILKLLERKVWQFRENQILTISALFPCFSVFSFFKLVQLICLVVEW